MKTKTTLSLTSLLLGSTLLVGCATKPIANFNNQPVPTGLNTTQVQNAIVTAGESRKWVMTDDGYNTITGNLDYKGYTVAIRIPYTSSSYSINYQSSTNLNYNNGKIHRAYNKWVTQLNRSIQKELRNEASRNR